MMKALQIGLCAFIGFWVFTLVVYVSVLFINAEAENKKCTDYGKIIKLESRQVAGTCWVKLNDVWVTVSMYERSHSVIPVSVRGRGV